MTRRRTCRCCGMASESTYCPPCGSTHVRHANAVTDVIRALWGNAGVTQYQTAVQAQRLAARRTTTKRTT